MNNKQIQLFIMPFAGGSASVFNEICGFLDDKIDVHVIEYPGRGTRISEPFCKTMEELIEDAKNQVSKKRNKTLPFALMGYSMGVEIVFDLAQFALSEKPSQLIVAAREAIYYDTKGHNYALLDMDMFTKKIIDFGGIDERVLNNKRFLDIYMRPVYADYKLLHEYMYHREKGSLNMDLTVFYCDRDTPFQKVAGWNEITSGNVDFIELGDNHFFIKQYAKEMAEIINRKLV